MLQSVPGFYLTNDRLFTYLGVRGIGRPTDYNGRIMIMVDGHVQNESVFGAAPAGTDMAIDFASVEKIEIIHGPGSALYGSHAMHAVINVITRTADSMDGLSISAHAGSREGATVRFGRTFDNGLQVTASALWEATNGANLYFPEYDAPGSSNGVAHGRDYEDRYGFRLGLRKGIQRPPSVSGSGSAEKGLEEYTPQRSGPTIRASESSCELKSNPSARALPRYEEDERAVPVYAAALEARGFSVVVASSERELCEAETSNAEAILIDLQTASASNALLQALQASKCLNVPIIVTAAEEPEWIGDQAATIARWVPKPASGEVVAEAVLKACAGVDVLVIEDDFDLARVLIAALERHAPSLIVLDLVVPELDGFAVVDWMRGRAPLTHIPLLVYSAREVSTAEQQQLTLGPTEFVTKSRVSIEEFEARVAHLLFAVTAAEVVHAA